MLYRRLLLIRIASSIEENTLSEAIDKFKVSMRGLECLKNISAEIYTNPLQYLSQESGKEGTYNNYLDTPRSSINFIYFITLTFAHWQYRNFCGYGTECCNKRILLYCVPSPEK